MQTRGSPGRRPDFRRALVFARVLPALCALVASTCLTVGCTTYHDELARGQRAFEVNEHDRTLAILRDLEPDLRRLSPPEQAEYAYLRGMTDYRIGYRSDARHWLSVAKALEEGSPGMLPVEWKDRINEALGALNDVVYTQGTSALLTTRVAVEEEGSGKRDGSPTPPPKNPQDSRDSKSDAKKVPSTKNDAGSPADDASKRDASPKPKNDGTK